MFGCSQAHDILYGGGDPDEKLVVAFNSQFVTRGKMETLQDGVWLNDEVINFYLLLLQRRNDDAVPEVPACFFFNSFFHSKVCSLHMVQLVRLLHSAPLVSLSTVNRRPERVQLFKCEAFYQAQER